MKNFHKKVTWTYFQFTHTISLSLWVCMFGWANSALYFSLLSSISFLFAPIREASKSITYFPFTQICVHRTSKCFCLAIHIVQVGEVTNSNQFLYYILKKNLSHFVLIPTRFSVRGTVRSSEVSTWFLSIRCAICTNKTEILRGDYYSKCVDVAWFVRNHRVTIGIEPTD